MKPMKRLAISLVLALVAAGPAAAGASTEPDTPVRAWVQRVIYTDEFGVDRPSGLAIDSATGVFYVTGRGNRGLVAITAIEDPAGSVPASDLDNASNVAFDNSTGRLVAFGGRGLTSRPLDLSTPADVVSSKPIANPRGITVNSLNGEFHVLDGTGPRIHRFTQSGDESVADLVDLSGQELRGLAHNPVDGLLYAAGPSTDSLFAIDASSGVVVEVFDLSDADIADPLSMAFAPSTDPTDDPAELSLFLLDGGLNTAGGRQGASILELALTAQPVTSANATAVLVPPVTATSALSPPSPDTSGITYLQHRGNLLISDSEVNEIPALYADVSLWELSPTRTELDTGESLSWSDEPTGLSYNPNTHHVYVSDDTGVRTVYDVDHGVDGRYGTTDDTVTQLAVGPLGSTDPEGVAYDPVSGHLFVVDGGGREVYEFAPGADGLFNGNGDTLVAAFDVEVHGALDPEGITYNAFDDTLLILDRGADLVFEVSKSGALIRVIDVSAAGGRKNAGIVLAPASNGSSGWNMYVVDRGVDNNSDPNENDGQLMELSLDFGPPPSGVPPVAVDDSGVVAEDGVVVVDVAVNDSDADGDLDPSSAMPVTAPGSGAAVGNGDGTITYTPDPDFFGSDGFDYRICDLSLQCDNASVTVTVTAVPDDPVAVDDSSVTVIDGVVVIDVAANDSDADGDLDPSSATPVTAPGSGAAAGNGDGTITYTPDSGFEGTDGFDYQICDLAGACDTASVSVTVGATGPAYYVSFASSTVVPGIAGSVSDEDVVVYDASAGSWSMFFDASDVGITTSDLDAFHVRDDGTMLLSFSSEISIPGLTGGPAGQVIDDSDLILFTPTSVGETTAGTFSFYFDGSDVDLTTNGEDINGVFEFPDGSLGISTSGSVTVGGLPKGGDEDVHRFTGTFGSSTSGSWVQHFDGSDVGFTDSAADLNGVTFNSPDLSFTTVGTYNIGGATAEDEDVSTFTGTYGPTTTGTPTQTLDLSTLGIDPSANIDSLHIANTVNTGP